MGNKIDIKTRVFLFITNARIVNHIEVEELDEKLELKEESQDRKKVYVFKNFDEYRNFFKMYLNEVNDDVIKLAIYTSSSEGSIIALKGLCEHIIVTKQQNERHQKVFKKQGNM